MKTFEFLADRIPMGYAFNFDNYLFNKIKHITTQGVEERADYFIVNTVKKRIEGKIHFLLKDGIAYSPYKSLFGSFEFTPRIHPNLFMEFWQFIEQDLKSRKIGWVKITNFAGCYAPKKADLILKTLSGHGFDVTLKAVNHHIHVDETPLITRMHAMEVRKLKKCINADLKFRREKKENVEEIYDYIDACRKEQNLRLSISKEKILQYQEEFPMNYPAFSVRKGEDIYSATITIKTHRHILYNFLPGSLQKYKAYSPTVMLNDGLYQNCQEHGYRMLDLGISTEPDGTDQESLIVFKERLGAQISYKYFFEKYL